MPSEPFAKRWPPWRLTMLGGSLALLLLAILDATADRPLPGLVTLILGASGYAALIIGFGLAMRARRPR